jgi:peptidyl-prolyl cis-trans isomerase D
VLAALFSADSVKDRRNTEAIEIAPGKLVSARIIDYQPAQRRPFEAVQAEVKAQYLASEARRLAQEAGQARLAALRATSAASASGSAQEGFSSVTRVRRSDPAGLPAKVLQATYRVAGDPLPGYTGADLDAEGYAVIELVRVLPASPAELDQALAGLTPQASRILAQQDALSTIESVKTRLKVERRPERLSAKTGSAQ